MTSHTKAVRLVGGPTDPRGGRTYDYPEPWPEVLAIQQFTGTGWITHDYRRSPNTNIYVYVQAD